MLKSDTECITETLEAINQLPIAMGRRLLRLSPSSPGHHETAFILGIPSHMLMRTLLFKRSYPRNKHKALYDKYPQLMKEGS